MGIEESSEDRIKEAVKPSPANPEFSGMIGSLEEYASLVGKKLSQLAESKYEPPEFSGMIGSLEEYASLVGKKVSQLAESKYEPPEVESSDDESEGEQAEEEGDLWGAIMGGK